MAIESTRDLCLSVADAIREKKGTSELINPQDFAKEIASIEGGGSGEGGGSTIEYLDLRNVTTLIGGQIPLKALVASLAYTVKIKNPNNGLITLLGAPALYSSFSSSVIPTLDFYEVEVNFKGIYGGNINDGIKTYHDTISQMGVTQEQLDSIPRITKEQFYDLNA